jgi:hypothetical protein
LANPKTPKSTRTIEISDDLVTLFRLLIEGRLADDFIFQHADGAATA